MNLVFIGFMGVGKTSVGRAVAGRLGRPFIDTDASIEHALAMSVAEIFKKHGEDSLLPQRSHVLLERFDLSVF